MKNWLENTLTFLGATFLIPLAILNFAGGIIAGVWLLIIGEWSLVVLGLIASFIYPFVFSIIMIPNLGIMYIAGWLFEKKIKLLTIISLFVASVYTQTVLVMWALSVLNGFVIENATHQNYIPLLLWGFGVVTSPLIYMAKHENDNATYLMVFLVEIGYIVLALVALFAYNYLLIQTVIAILFILGWSIFATILVASKMFAQEK